jgi:hypothetical protein
MTLPPVPSPEGDWPGMRRALSVAPERLGWEYREPHPPRVSPERAMEPVWYEPPGPGPRSVPQDVGARKSIPVRASIAGTVLFVGLLLGKAGILFDLIALGLAAYWFIPMLQNATEADTAKTKAVSVRDQQWAQFQAAWQQWRASVENWDRGERARVAQVDRWFPVTWTSGADRLDVFGGTPGGWAALVTTYGASVLAANHGVVLLDLTEHDIAHDLLELAESRELPVRVVDLPAQISQANLLAGLSAEDVSELLAEAIHSGRGREVADMRGIDADLIRAVVQRLDSPLSLRKLTAGLQVLRQVYDTSGDLGPLSPTEFQRLAGYVDLIGRDQQALQELPILVSALDLLASAEGQVGEGGFDMGGAAVVAIRTGDRNARRKDLADRVLVQVLTHHLRLGGLGHRGDVLAVVGGDHLGLKSMESLAREGRRAGLRTVFIFEHLRGDLQQFLGGSDSTSLIMRLGNAQEAAAAAEYIGRGSKFVLNQITRQFSDANTEGESKQWGATGTVTDSSSWGGSAGGRHWGSSTSVSRADTWSRTKNWSTTVTNSDGTVVSRVYEFTVEPTQIQSLPVTAFVQVGSVSGQRRLLVADCNPGICLLDHVAGGPALPAPATRPAVEASVDLGAVSAAVRAAAERAELPPAGERPINPYEVPLEARPKEWRPNEGRR